MIYTARVIRTITDDHAATLSVEAEIAWKKPSPCFKKRTWGSFRIRKTITLPTITRTVTATARLTAWLWEMIGIHRIADTVAAATIYEG